MNKVVINPIKTVDQNIMLLLEENEEIIFKHNVLALDKTVVNPFTVEIFATSRRLFITYDESIEIYNLPEMDFTLIGDAPKFTTVQHILEGTFLYPQDLEKMKNFDGLTRVSIAERGSIPQSFLLRTGVTVLKPFQNWAFYQLLLNIKNGIATDDMLVEMIDGNFSQFNTKTIVTFIGTFALYLLFKFIISLGLPDILGTIIDWMFSGVLIFMLVWVYLALEKNNKRFCVKYKSYSTN